MSDKQTRTRNEDVKHASEADPKRADLELDVEVLEERIAPASAFGVFNLGGYSYSGGLTFNGSTQLIGILLPS